MAYHRKLRGKDLFLPERVGEESSDSAGGDGRPRDFEAIAGVLCSFFRACVWRWRGRSRDQENKAPSAAVPLLAIIPVVRMSPREPPLLLSAVNHAVRWLFVQRTQWKDRKGCCFLLGVWQAAPPQNRTYGSCTPVRDTRTYGLDLGPQELKSRVLPTSMGQTGPNSIFVVCAAVVDNMSTKSSTARHPKTVEPFAMT